MLRRGPVATALAEQRRHYATPQGKPHMSPGAFDEVAGRHLEGVLAVLPPATGRVLEVGAGMGRFSFAMRRRGLAVVASDLSPELLAELRRWDAAGAVCTVCCDVAELTPQQVGPVDAAVGFFVLHHLPELASAFAALRRILRPGAPAVFVEPNPLHLGYYAQVALTPGMAWRTERGLLRMRRRVLAAAMESAGFALAAVERYGWLPPALARRPWGRRLDSWVEAARPLHPLLAYQRIRGVAV